MNYTYILLCKDGSYYTGYTNDLEARFDAHMKKKGAKYTKSHPPVAIVYAEMYEDKREALAREREIKKMKRKDKQKLIKSPSKGLRLIDHEKVMRRYFMKNLKFYRCDECEKIFITVHDSEKTTGLKEIVANTTEAATEKHIPVVTREGDVITVEVGSVEHPMTEEHYIEFIVLQTEKGFRVAYLEPTDAPKADFYANEPVIAVYAYCNLHGLWKTEI